jgi:hypothetical protein
VVGKQFEESPHLARPAQQRQNDDGRDAKRPAGFEVHTRIGLGVVAAEELAAGNAFAGESGAHLQPGTNCGGAGSGAGAANHFVSLREGEGGSGGSGDVLGALDEELEGCA